MNGFNCDISKISRISRFIMAFDVCHCDVWQTFRISKFNGIQEFLCVWIFIILFSTKLNYREINALYNRYILSCCVNLKQHLEGELSYNNVKLRKREMDEGFFPPLFSCNHSRGGATFNGIRRDGFFLSRHEILVVVEAGEKAKKLGRTWRTNRSNYQRRSVIQQAELPSVKEISQAWLAMVDDQCCIKYEGRKEK